MAKHPAKKTAKKAAPRRTHEEVVHDREAAAHDRVIAEKTFGTMVYEPFDGKPHWRCNHPGCTFDTFVEDDARGHRH
jgi:hypothetical protein